MIAMRSLRNIATGFRSLFQKKRADRELDEELRGFMEMAAEESMKEGRSEKEALRAVRLERGSVEAAKEVVRSAGWESVLETSWQDLRYGLRVLRKSPGFTAVAVLILALGIGANASVFSVLYRDLLRPLPYPHGNRLVFFGMLMPSFDSRPFIFSASYEQLRRGRTPFEAITSWRPGVAGCDLTEDQPLHLPCVRAESTFLPTFGIIPTIGSNFSAEEDGPDAPRVCLISYVLWQSRFGGNSSALGQMLSIDGHLTKIIGVLPRTFEWPTLDHVDLILPEALSTSELTNPMAGVLRAYARLKPGISLAEARAQLGPALEEWRRASPPMFRKEMELGLLSVREDQVGSIRLALLVLFGASLALLLLGAVNVANLLLARGAAREHELAIRAALGASRSNLMRLQLTESTLLGLFGGAAGAGIAFALLRLFVALAPAGIPRIAQAGLGVPVLTFVFGTSLLAGLVCGLIPARNSPPIDALRGGSSPHPHRARLGGALVAGQVAMSFVLVIAAGLFLETLRNIDAAPLGIETNHAVTAEITLGQAYKQPGASSEFFDRLEARLRNLPGVTGVAVSDSLPPTGGGRAHPFYEIRVEGRPPVPRGTGGLVGWSIVSPDYFRILGIPILQGRGFVSSDQDPHADVVVVNRKLAARLFSGDNAIGQRLQLSSPSGPWYTVVGVAGNVKYLNPGGKVERSAPGYYVPRTRLGAPGTAESRDLHAFFIVRTPLNPAAMERLVRVEISSLDPTLPAETSTLKARVDLLRVEPRFNAALITLFAGLGFLLATIGLYGVVSFLVAARTKEIGVRMALGASPRSVLGIVLGRGVRLILAGLVVGTPLAFALAHSVKGLLYGVSGGNPAIAGFAALLLLLAGLAASYIPARRAMRVDPMIALRYE